MQSLLSNSKTKSFFQSLLSADCKSEIKCDSGHQSLAEWWLSNNPQLVSSPGVETECQNASTLFDVQLPLLPSLKITRTNCQFYFDGTLINIEWALF